MAPLYSQLFNAPELVTYHFRFQVNTTNDPDFIIPGKCGVTDIVHTDGPPVTFDITFAEKHPHFVTMSGCLFQAGALGAGDAIVPVVVSYTASTGVLVIKMADPDAAGVPAAATPDDDTWVCLSVTFCRRDALGTSTGVAI